MKRIETVEIKEVEYNGGNAYRLYVNGEYTPIVAKSTDDILKALDHFSVAIRHYIYDRENRSLLYHADCMSDYSGYKTLYKKRFNLLSI